jgi:hypothetical protein
MPDLEKGKQVNKDNLTTLETKEKIIIEAKGKRALKSKASSKEAKKQQ